MPKLALTGEPQPTLTAYSTKVPLLPKSCNCQSESSELCRQAAFKRRTLQVCTLPSVVSWDDVLLCREVQRILMELLNQMDGFDQNVNVKVRLQPSTTDPARISRISYSPFARSRASETLCLCGMLLAWLIQDFG